MAEQSTYTATNLPRDGETIDASDVNTDLQGLIDEFNKEVGSEKLASESVTAEKIADNAITLGFAEVTANQGSITTITDLTGLSVTVTVPSNGRRVKITGFCFLESSVANDYLSLVVRESTTELSSTRFAVPFSGQGQAYLVTHVLSPSAGSHTYKLSARRDTGTGTVTMTANSNRTAYILVEAI